MHDGGETSRYFQMGTSDSSRNSPRKLEAEGKLPELIKMPDSFIEDEVLGRGQLFAVVRLIVTLQLRYTLPSV